jgi:hypothetical protein
MIESLSPGMLNALLASMPKDWTAANPISRVGNHIFAKKFFITKRQSYE